MKLLRKKKNWRKGRSTRNEKRIQTVLTIPLPSDTDRDGILAHELAHRVDILVYRVAQKEEWTAAIQHTENAILNDTDSVQKWFVPGGKYYDNPF